MPPRGGADAREGEAPRGRCRWARSRCPQPPSRCHAVAGRSSSWRLAVLAGELISSLAVLAGELISSLAVASQRCVL